MIHPVVDSKLVGAVSIELGAFGTPVLLIDGQPAPKGEKPGRFVVQTTSGPATAMFRPSLRRTAPSLNVNGRLIEVGKAIPIWLLVLAMLPIGLVGVGGALGGGLGGAGAAANLGVARSSLKLAAKLAIMIGIAALAVGSYAVIAALVLG
jgi:hypothetical protein